MKKIALLGIALVMLAAALGAWRAIVHPYEGFRGRRVLEIPPDTPTLAVAQTLQRNGVLAKRWPFLLLVVLGKLRHDRLMAGEYEFTRPVSPLDVFRKIAHGRIYLHKVVIPEGADRFDMARIFGRKLGLNPHAFLKATKNTALIKNLDPRAPTLEGFLFPDTYRFPSGVSASVVVATMVKRFRHVLKTRFSSELNDPPISLHEAVIVASMVEKEAVNNAEQPQIAEVFERRLKRGMPLESDPTVLYADRLRGKFIADSDIRASDLRYKSPYNTYATAGLPPGPICSPGASALWAAWHPAPGDYLYFVTDIHGGHDFSRTLAGHLRNVARYRRALAAEKRQAARERHAARKPHEPARRKPIPKRHSSYHGRAGA